MIRMDRLSAFVVFAEERSFTRAARRLNLSQPALHVQIRNLSADLGVALYVREGRSLSLTDAGRAVAAFGREIAGRTDRFLADLHGVAPEQPVVLCAGEAITRYRLVPAIQATSAPLRLVLGNADQALAMIADGRAHLAVVGATGPRPGIDARPLLAVPQMIAIPRGHPLWIPPSSLSSPQTPQPPPLSLTDLAGHDLIVPPPGRPHREALAAALAARDLPWQVAVEAQGWDLMVQLVAAGLGLAVVNGIVPAPPDVALRPVHDLPQIRYDLLRREDAPAIPAVDDLVDCLFRACDRP